MIDDKTFDKVLELGRFRVSDEEQKHFKEQIGDILSYVEKLEEVDTSHIDPDLGNAVIPEQMRKDESSESLAQDKIASLTPHFEDGFFRVPQIIEDMEA
jgi:aspartyl-tRNA(Asn)/glutamyl-tRNA(Gln) amidotransferase subunit C